jgi:Tol biopolymer transport system component
MTTSFSTHPVLRRRRLALPVVALALIASALVAASQPPADAAAHGDRVQRAKLSNGHIAFVRRGKIFTVTEQGSGLTKLTPRGNNSRPHFSPDGERIAYTKGSRATGWNIMVMHADGSNKQRVTHVNQLTEAQWSPDGKWLAFGGPVLSKIRSTKPFGAPIPLLGDLGSGPEEILVDISLDWSPDGQRIAYYSHQYPDSPDNFLLVLHLVSGEVSVVWEVGGSCCGEGYFNDPAWSRDGSRLAYNELLYFPEDGGTKTRPHIEVDNYPSRTTAGYPEMLGDKDPEFSPDGAQLLMAHVSRARVTIQVTDIDGNNMRVIGRGYQPDWQPRPST